MEMVSLLWRRHVVTINTVYAKKLGTIDSDLRDCTLERVLKINYFIGLDGNK